MLIMLIFPFIEALAFWILLRKPSVLPVTSVESTEELIVDDKPLQGFKEKFMYIKHLVKYMVPLALVYSSSISLIRDCSNWFTSRTPSWIRPPSIDGLMWTIKLVCYITFFGEYLPIE
ncbi:hypothetical protein DOY81_015055 [Sarcophaga bullata]|nr:hypothetical protein DOY81_015055 [Sarcophaga bullata]